MEANAQPHQGEDVLQATAEESQKTTAVQVHHEEHESMLEIKQNGSNSQKSDSPGPPSPRSVEGFVTSVELNSCEDTLGALPIQTGGFPGTVAEQPSGPFSVYVSSSPEPASLDTAAALAQESVVVDHAATSPVVVDHAAISPVLPAAVDNEDSVPAAPVEPTVEITHAQSFVEVLAPPSPIQEPELVFIPPNEHSESPSPINDAVSPAPAFNPPVASDLMTTSVIYEEPLSSTGPESELIVSASTPSPVFTPAPMADLMTTSMILDEPIATLPEPAIPSPQNEANLLEDSQPHFTDTEPEAKLSNNILISTEPTEVSQSLLQAVKPPSPKPRSVTPDSQLLLQESTVYADSAPSVVTEEAKVSPDSIQESSSIEIVSPTEEKPSPVEPVAVAASPKETKAKPAPTQKGVKKAPVRATLRSAPGPKAEPAKTSSLKATTTMTSTKTTSTKPLTPRPAARAAPKVTPTSRATPSSRPTPGTHTTTTRTTTKPTPSSQGPTPTTRGATRTTPVTSRTTPAARTQTRTIPARSTSGSATRTTATTTSTATRTAATSRPSSSTTTPTSTRRTPVTTTTTSRTADKTDSKLTNGTVTKTPTRRTPVTAPGSATRKPLAAKTTPAAAEKKEVKNTTNKLLSSRMTSTTASRTANVSRTNSAASSTTRATASKTTKTTSSSTTSTAAVHRTMATKTSGVSGKRFTTTAVNSSKTSKTPTSRTTKEAPSKQVAPASPAGNGENKIADEDCTIEVKDKVAEEAKEAVTVEPPAEKTLDAVLTSEDVIVPPAEVAEQIMVNGEH